MQGLVVGLVSEVYLGDLGATISVQNVAVLHEGKVREVEFKFLTELECSIQLGLLYSVRRGGPFNLGAFFLCSGAGVDHWLSYYDCLVLFELWIGHASKKVLVSFGFLVLSRLPAHFG